MPSTIVTTPKSASANSFIDVAYADTYFDDSLNATAWTGAVTDDKTRALLQAARLMDDLMIWKGDITDDDQALSWPRYGVWDHEGDTYDEDTYPVILERAQAELAHYLLKSDRIAEPGLLGQGFSEVQAGPVKVKVDKTALLDYFPTHVIAMLSHVGEVNPDAGRNGPSSATLERV